MRRLRAACDGLPPTVFGPPALLSQLSSAVQATAAAGLSDRHARPPLLLLCSQQHHGPLLMLMQPWPDAYRPHPRPNCRYGKRQIIWRLFITALTAAQHQEAVLLAVDAPRDEALVLSLLARVGQPRCNPAADLHMRRVQGSCGCSSNCTTTPGLGTAAPLRRSTLPAWSSWTCSSWRCMSTADQTHRQRVTATSPARLASSGRVQPCTLDIRWAYTGKLEVQTPGHWDTHIAC
jgi:hypothetical protein